MPGFALEKLVGSILVIIGFIILAIVLFGMQAGASFWYMGCEGEIGGTGPYFVQGKWVYENQKCTILEDKTMCELTTYKNITREDGNFTICIWLPDNDPNTPDCYFNGLLTCEDFSQNTAPKCDEVPDCKKISAIKAAIDRLKPE